MNYNDRRSVWEHFAEMKIYLSTYALQCVVDQLSISKNVFGDLLAFEREYNVSQYKGKQGKLKSAFVTENKHDEYCEKSSKAVYQIDFISGDIIAEHHSIYQAAQSIGKPVGFSLISAAIHGKTKKAYGFKWILKSEYDKKNK